MFGWHDSYQSGLCAKTMPLCVCTGVDPKSIVCEYFRAGQCTKGFKCKFSHDLAVERKGGKIDLFTDTYETHQAATHLEPIANAVATALLLPLLLVLLLLPLMLQLLLLLLPLVLPHIFWLLNYFELVVHASSASVVAVAAAVGAAAVVAAAAAFGPSGWRAPCQKPSTHQCAELSTQCMLCTLQCMLHMCCLVSCRVTMLVRVYCLICQIFHLFFLFV